MNPRTDLTGLILESLEASVTERAAADTLIQERNQIAVTGYWIEPEKCRTLALAVSIDYTAHEVSDPAAPREIASLTAKATALFATDALEGMTRQQAENLLETDLMQQLRPLYETAANQKIQSILADFRIRSRLPLGTLY